MSVWAWEELLWLQPDDQQELQRTMHAWCVLDGAADSADKPSQRRPSCKMSPLQWTDLERQTLP